QDGEGDLSSCSVSYNDGESSGSVTGTLYTGYGNSSEAKCNATIDNAIGDIQPGEAVDIDVTFTDNDGGTATTPTETAVLPNHPPVIVQGVQFTNYSTRHAFNVSAIAKDVDEGSSEITICTVHHTDGETTYTTTGTLDTSYGTTDEAKCTLTIEAEVDGGFTGYRPTESIDVWVEFTDKHGRGMGTGQYRRVVSLTSNHGKDLTNFPASVTLDTASLIDAGKLQPDCEDIRVYEDGALVKYNVTNCNTATTTIYFATDIAAGATEEDVTITYGHPFNISREQRIPTRIINGKGNLGTMAYWCSNIDSQAPNGLDSFYSGIACNGVNQSTPESDSDRHTGFNGIGRGGNGDWETGPVSGAPTIGEGEDADTLDGNDAGNSDKQGYSAFITYSGNHSGFGLKGVKVPGGVSAHAWFHVHWASSDQHNCGGNIWVGTLNETACGGSERVDAGWFVGDGEIGPSGDWLKKSLLNSTAAGGDWSTQSAINVKQGQWVYPFAQDTKWGGGDDALAQIDDFYWSDSSGNEIMLSATTTKTTVSSILPNSKPKVELRKTFPSSPEFGESVVAQVNVTDQDDDALVWANYTVWEHNDRTANRIYANQNGSVGKEGEYWLWNSTSFQADLENGTYNWSVTVSDGWSTTSTTGRFALVEVAPHVSHATLVRPSPWGIESYEYRPGQTLKAYVTVTDLNGRSEITEYAADVVNAAGGIEASGLELSREGLVLNGYNLSVFYTVPEDGDEGQWQLNVSGTDVEGATGFNATGFGVTRFASVTLEAQFNISSSSEAFVDGSSASTGIYSSLSFPYVISQGRGTLSGLVNYGSFQRLGFQDGSRPTVNMTQGFADNLFLLPMAAGDVNGLEVLESQFTDTLLSPGRSFLNQATASIAYGTSPEKSIRATLDYSDNENILFKGFNASLGQGIHELTIRNAGVENGSVVVEVVR
ncbi:MAG: hypothetical protein SVU32_09795, partial [Candidatus Nanohaloarchaea archaeon]|nr:hypothetical protein [Candidatus Nanohaloarchaea archaeon]